jgi:hypothetical protein
MILDNLVGVKVECVGMRVICKVSQRGTKPWLQSFFENIGFLRLKSWDSASMLGLANTSGKWDLGSHVIMVLNGIKWIMVHGHLDYFQIPPLGGRPNTKPGDHGTPNAHNR